MNRLLSAAALVLALGAPLAHADFFKKSYVGGSLEGAMAAELHDLETKPSTPRADEWSFQPHTCGYKVPYNGSTVMACAKEVDENSATFVSQEDGKRFTITRSYFTAVQTGHNPGDIEIDDLWWNPTSIMLCQPEQRRLGAFTKKAVANITGNNSLDHALLQDEMWKRSSFATRILGKIGGQNYDLSMRQRPPNVTCADGYNQLAEYVETGKRPDFLN
jgi:hypothetical protein